VKLTIGLYADDTTGYISDKEDYLNFLKEVEWYCNASSAQLNISKSSIIFLGKPFETLHLQAVPKREADRLLGVLIGSETKKKTVHEAAVKKFEERCSRWSTSPLSINSRTAMVRIFAESTLEFSAPFHPYSSLEIKRIKMVYWGAIYRKAKLTKQKYNCAALNESWGGIGALTIEKRLEAHLAAWIPLAQENKTKCWVILFMQSVQLSPLDKQGDLVEASRVWWAVTNTQKEKPEWKVKNVYAALSNPPRTVLRKQDA
jgi:hypothetical protein